MCNDATQLSNNRHTINQWKLGEFEQTEYQTCNVSIAGQQISYSTLYMTPEAEALLQGYKGALKFH